jgi:hypothetical protein
MLRFYGESWLILFVKKSGKGEWKGSISIDPRQNIRNPKCMMDVLAFLV